MCTSMETMTDLKIKYSWDSDQIDGERALMSYLFIILLAYSI